MQKKIKFLAALIVGCGLSLTLSGCSQGEWSSFWVGVNAPGPGVGPAPYAYEYYYAPAYQAYYCYYPDRGWCYFPGEPPAGAVFYSGSVAYLPPPGPPPTQVQFYFDRDHNAYYYHGPHNRWHFLPGRPPQGAPQWRGPHPGPHQLPPPVFNRPFRGRRQPQRGQGDPHGYQQRGGGPNQYDGNGNGQGNGWGH